MDAVTPIKGLILATRTDRYNDSLGAFLAHHLQICEKAVVLVDHREGMNTDEAVQACLPFGDRVRVVLRADKIFHNGRSCDALSEEVAKEEGDLVLHLDKDEFCKSLWDVPGIVERIRAGVSDFAEARMVCRFAPGGRFYPDHLPTYRDYCVAAPVRSHIVGSYGFPDVKCYITRKPYIKIHYGQKGWRKDKQGMTLEHFRWTDRNFEKCIEKEEQHPKGLRGSVRWRCRNVSGRTPDFLAKLDKHFRPHAWGLAGWMNFGDAYRVIARWLPSGGTFCELGVFQGRSLSYMGEYLALLEKKVNLIGYDTFCPEWKTSYGEAPMNIHSSDEWVAKVEAAMESFCPWCIPKVVRSKSDTAASLHADGSVDALWVDAGHDKEDVIADLTAWLPKLRAGAVLAGHDHPLREVRQALEVCGIPVKRISKISWVATDPRFSNPF